MKIFRIPHLNLMHLIGLMPICILMYSCDPNYMRNYKISAYNGSFDFNDSIFKLKLSNLCKKYSGKEQLNNSFEVFSCSNMADSYGDTNNAYGYFSIIQNESQKYVRIGNGLKANETKLYGAIHQDISNLLDEFAIKIDAIGVKSAN